MLLAIDCGNTNTSFAVFDGDICLGTWRTSTNAARTADEYAVWLTQLLALGDLPRSEINAIIIANVVPDIAFNLDTLCRIHFNLEPIVVGRPDVDLGIDIRIDNASEVGADRLVNAVGARDRYNGPLIVIDFGTATTFDVIEEDGAYAGGLIAPGINLSVEALHKAAAQLPRVSIHGPPTFSASNKEPKVIGKSTQDAMHSGVFWGYIGLIEGIVSRVQKEYGEGMSVIATGGLASVFGESTDAIEYVDPDITLRGLVQIYQRNK